MSADRNLLFGVLALQADLLDAIQFAQACSAWAASKGTPLADLLVERGWLTPEDRADVDKLVARKLKKHGGDACASLAEVTTDPVRHSLLSVADPDVQQSLAELPTPGSTTAYQPQGRGRYTLTHLHAQGGIGQVWLAHDSDLRRDVALKELRPERQEQPAAKARFLEEARVTGQLEHPGIVPVHELVRPADGRPFYTMRLVRGRTLAEAIKDYHRKRQAGEVGPLDMPSLLRSFVAVCQAVAYAHSRGVLHRDLKPANVVLGDYGEAMVLDWGLARLLGRNGQPQAEPTSLLPVSLEGGSRDETVQGQVLGTPAYMAPEQAEGRLDLLGPATDVYALGAVLYEVLTGEPPFSGPSDEVLRRVTREEPERPRLRVPATPRGLEAVCLKALAKKPGERYASARDLAKEVERWLADEPVGAYRDPALVRAARWARKHRTKMAGAAAALLVALAALSVGLVVVGGLNGRLEAANLELTDSNAQLEAARAEAEKERNIAVAVNDFLRGDLLGQADIGNQPFLGEKEERNPNVTVAELLSRAAKAVEGRFPGQPQTEGAIRRTIGDAYRALGRYEQAQPHLERSAALLERKLGGDHPDTLASKNRLALLYHRQGRHEKAKQLFLEVLRQVEEKLGTDHPFTLTDKSNLALLYYDQGQYPSAERLFLDVLRRREQKLGADHPHTLTSKCNLALLYQAQRKYDRAEPLLLEVLRLQEKVLGADHPDTLTSKNNLAALYKGWGKFDKAESLFLEALGQMEKKRGAAHPSTLTCKNNLATLYQAQRKFDSAEPLLLEVLRLREKVLEADHPSTLNSKNNLAALYWSMGRLERSIPLFEELLQRQTKVLGADHPKTLLALANLGVNYRDAGRLDEGIRRLEEALMRARARPGGVPAELGSVPGALVEAYDRNGQFAKSEGLYRASVEQARKLFGAADLRTAGPLAQLGKNLLQQKKHAEAEKALRDCLGIRQKAQPDDWTTFNAKSLLGEALLVQKKYADAEPLLVQGCEGMLKRAGKIPSRVRAARLKEALERLVRLYEAAGNKDEAARWRKKLEEANKPATKEAPKK
jgi:tetratricopeptide (TPR) repeat protein/tRNA A-37 threonylcarbamoyl transferase component Bud32